MGSIWSCCIICCDEASIQLNDPRGSFVPNSPSIFNSNLSILRTRSSFALTFHDCLERFISRIETNFSRKIRQIHTEMHKELVTIRCTRVSTYVNAVYSILRRTMEKLYKFYDVCERGISEGRKKRKLLVFYRVMFALRFFLYRVSQN